MATPWDIQDIRDIRVIRHILDILDIRDIRDIHTFHMGRKKKKRKAKIRKSAEETGAALQVTEAVVVEEKRKERRRRTKTRKLAKGAHLHRMIPKRQRAHKLLYEQRQQLQLLRGHEGVLLLWLEMLQAHPKEVKLRRWLRWKTRTWQTGPVVS